MISPKTNSTRRSLTSLTSFFEGFALLGFWFGIVEGGRLFLEDQVVQGGLGEILLFAGVSSSIVTICISGPVFLCLLAISRFRPRVDWKGVALLGGAAAAFGVTALPTLLHQNLERPGFSISWFYLGPYLKALSVLFLVALGAGLGWRRLVTSWGQEGCRRARIAMRRITGLAVLVLVVVSVVRIRGSEDKSKTDSRFTAQCKSSVLLVTVDTLRADHLGIYGYDKRTDPEIRRFFEAGMVFADAVSPVPQTRPSHAAMLTGRHPAELGMRWNDRSLPNSATTLAEILREQGFQTAAFVSGWPLVGKTSGLERGFEVYSDRFSRLIRGRHSLAELPLMILLRKLRCIDTVTRDARAVTDDVMQWLQRDRQSCFFLWIHYYDPHSRYEPPKSYAREMGLVEGPWNNRGIQSYVLQGKGELSAEMELRANALYDGEIRFVDQQVGRIFRYLEQEDLVESTLVILTSDHGETLLERVQSDSTAFAHGAWLDEWDLRIPMIMRGPGVPDMLESTTTAQLHDLAPTIVASLGLPIPAGFMGQDLLASPEPTSILRPSLSMNAPKEGQPDLVSARGGGYKLVLAPESGSEALFDLRADPRAENDLIDAFPEVAQELRDSLSAMELVDQRSKLSDKELERLRTLGYFQ